MPIVQIELTDQEYARLQEVHCKAQATLSQTTQDTLPPTFEQWLVQALPSIRANVENADGELSSIRAFTTMENMVFSLHKHGFVLAHAGKNHAQSTQLAQELAQAIVNDMQLQPQYVKRVQDLLMHFMKTTRELVDAAQIGLTSRGQAALTEAYRLLVERTEKALEHLGGERAIGRVEGGAAILAGLDVMDRDTAKKKTDDFKIKVRTGARFK